MPNLDRTGPQRKGPLTGRRKGRCGNNQNEKSENKFIENDESNYGLGFGRKSRGGNRGGGRGNRQRRMGRDFGRK